MFLERDRYARAHAQMIDLLYAEGIQTASVVAAMQRVPRHVFVSEAFRYRAYDNTSLPIGSSQTISSPVTVAKMISSLNITRTSHVLEVGTGSGYQCAVLAEIAAHVVSLERIKELHDRARELLVFQLGYKNVSLSLGGDFTKIGQKFDCIIVAAGARELPNELLCLLKPGASIVIPLSSDSGHTVKKYSMKPNGTFVEEHVCHTQFVPLVH